MHRERQIGQLLTIGFHGTEIETEFWENAEYLSPGGFVLFKRNVSEPEGIRRLTDGLQKLSPEHRAFVAVDQEGGTVARLRAPHFTEFPGNRALTIAYRADDSTVYVAEQAAHFALELRTVGINWDFAPVLDVDSNPNNPVIGHRAFSDDPDEVATLGVAFAEALEGQGVLSCGKHVPGHGNTSLDSHHDLPIEETDLETLRGRELKPFRAYAEAGLSALMTAHVVYKAVDDTRPATLSEKVIQQIVRKEIGFAGMVVTDDMEMKAIDDRYGIEDATLQAVVAGCDVILICHTPEKQRAAYEALLREDRKSRVVRERIDAALGRIMKAKKKLTAPPAFDSNAIGRDDAIRLAEFLKNLSSLTVYEDPTKHDPTDYGNG